VATCGPGRGRSGAGGGRTAEMRAGSTGDGTGCVPVTAPARKPDRSRVYWWMSKQTTVYKSLYLSYLELVPQDVAKVRVSVWDVIAPSAESCFEQEQTQLSRPRGSGKRRLHTKWDHLEAVSCGCALPPDDVRGRPPWYSSGRPTQTQARSHQKSRVPSAFSFS
jgi:hypothetical protein